MYRIFKLSTIAAMLSLAVWAGRAGAASIAYPSGGWGNALTVTANTLAANRPAIDTPFTPSGGVRVAYVADAATGNFASVAQHQRGDIQYGIHSAGGAVYNNGVVIGTWEDPPEVTALAGTTFASSGGWSVQ